MSEESDRKPTKAENIEWHKKKHQEFDLLFACFIQQNPHRASYLGASLKEFMEWSYEMTQVGHD